MSEVRRCAACGEAAAVCLREWGERAMMGLVDTGETAREDFVCQGCGVAFSLGRRDARIKPALVAGMPLAGIGSCIGTLSLPLVFRDPSAGYVAAAALVVGGLGTGVLWWAAQPWLAFARHPVVPDAPVPDVRFPLPAPPRRRCRCGEPADCVETTAYQSDGLPQGTRRAYRCPACGEEFSVEDTVGLAGMLVASGLFATLGLALMTAAPGNGAGAWVCSGSVALFGLAGLLGAVVLLVSRLRHPLVRR